LAQDGTRKWHELSLFEGLCLKLKRLANWGQKGALAPPAIVPDVIAYSAAISTCRPAAPAGLASLTCDAAPRQGAAISACVEGQQPQQALQYAVIAPLR